VVDVKGRFLTELRQATVLASVTSALDNEPAELGIDKLSQATPVRHAVPSGG
jgi:hypothetical protein